MLGGDVVTRIRIIVLVMAIVVIVASVALIRRGGETAGAAKVTAKVEKAHAQSIVEPRADERAAATVTQSIAARTVRIDAATDAYIKTTIEDLRNALAAVPPAAAGAALPAAPVDRLRDQINAGIDRANRSADAAERLTPLSAKPTGEPVTIDKGILTEVYERLAEAVGAVWRGNTRAAAVKLERRCTLAILSIGRAPADCPAAH
ncbi:hypothetical protein [Sphingomonas faeni]|uniref:hypothetical protein n=1 Tax=Sphingomonas faeni TaxID=185950 RepID=UPI002413484E|nr:hypothetical protein [Sphingomonas faeni]